MNVYERFVRTIGATRWFAVFGRHVLTPIDRMLHGKRLSLTTFGTDFPMVYLTTTGRRSGEPRTTPLLLIEGGPGWMVAATNFGGPPPGWALNLRAKPLAVLERRGSRHEVTARLATAKEQDAAWPHFEAVWPAFAAYRRRAARQIDVFVLTPEETPERAE